MAFAARFTDMSIHGGMISAGVSTKVFIEKLPAAVQTSMHTCPQPPPPAGIGPHPPTPFTQGHFKIKIQGMPAVDSTYTCGCGASLISGTGSLKVIFKP